MVRVAGPRLRVALLVADRAAALGQLPRARLLVAADPEPGRRAQLGAATGSGLPDQNIAYTNWAMWLVFTYIWFPFMVLPVYAALERIPDSYLEASADLGARGRDDAAAGDPAARGARARGRLDLHLLAHARRLHRAVARRRAELVSSSATSSSTNVGIANNVPVRGRVRDGAARDHGRLPRADEAPRGVREPVMETRAPASGSGSGRALVFLFLWIPLVIMGSTRSTRRTCRAGRSPASRRSGSRSPGTTRRCATRSGSRSGAGCSRPAIALVLGSLAAFALSPRASSSGATRSRSSSCCRSRCRGSSPGWR